MPIPDGALSVPPRIATRSMTTAPPVLVIVKLAG
jgi:hypothetical protein